MLSVLLVDDDPQVLEVTREYLERKGGLRTGTAVSARDALRILEESGYDVIVSDYKMPEMDGIDLLKEIRSRDDRTPFIIFTGKGREDVAMEALNNGADFYIQKDEGTEALFSELYHNINRVSEIRKAEAALRESEERYRLINSSTMDCIYATDLDCRITYANRAFCRRLGEGFNEENVLGRSCHELDMDDRLVQMMQDLVRRVLYEEEMVEVEVAHRCHDGSTCHYLTILNPMYDDDGELVGVVGVEHDITERKQLEKDLQTMVDYLIDTERSLEEVEQSYHTLFERMHDAFALHEIVLDEMGAPVDCRFMDVNPAFERVTGLKAEDVVGKTVKEIIPGIEDYWISSYGEVALTGEPTFFVNYSQEFGSYFQVTAFSPAPMRFACIFDDVTPIRNAEIALKESEERLNLAIEGMNAGLWDWDMVNDVITFSSQWKGMLGYSDEEIENSSKGWRSLRHPDDEGYIERVMEEYLSGKKRRYELSYRMRRKDDGWCWVLARGKVLRDEDGEPYRWVGINIDITPLRTASESLRMANRKLQLLTSVTRHDILNNLLVLKGYIELAEGLEKSPELAEMHERMSGATDSIERQIIFTREYDMIGSEEPMWMSLCDTLKRLNDPGLTISDECAGVHVLADPMLHKVFSNLLDNSHRHAPDAGVLRVVCRDHTDGLHILFEDDGPGIPYDEKELIFERGFGKNTGLGLFLAREILSLTGITITEDGVPGEGAVFDVHVPKGSYSLG